MSNLLITKDRLLKKEGGFTLIEIVLVLAIAGLLLVIVFLAVSGAQKSRRDTQRKGDLGRLFTQIENYASNNNGAYPANMNTPNFGTTGTYTPSNFNDPTTGGNYFGIAAGTAGSITYTLGSGAATACDGSAMTGTRNFKVQMQLEQGIACRDNK